MTAAARLRERLAGQPTVGVIGLGDPHAPTVTTVRGVALTSRPVVRAAEHDVVLILTAHAHYDSPPVVAEAGFVVDPRNATAGVVDAARVIRL